MLKATKIVVCLILTGGLIGLAWGHCQIPCGIYDDEVRFALLSEHIATIEKSMTQINALSSDPAANANQLVRWISNKEHHADEFRGIITEYFLQQRIKPVDKSDETQWDAYVNKVTLCHEMLVTVMKTKQTTDLEQCKKLKSLLEAFRTAYDAKS